MRYVLAAPEVLLILPHVLLASPVVDLADLLVRRLRRAVRLPLCPSDLVPDEGQACLARVLLHGWTTSRVFAHQHISGLLLLVEDVE